MKRKMSPPLRHPSDSLLSRRAGTAKQSQTSGREETPAVNGAAGGGGEGGEAGRGEGVTKGKESPPRVPIRKGCVRPVEQEVLQRGSSDGKGTNNILQQYTACPMWRQYFVT